MCLDKFFVAKVLVWVKFFNIPLDLWTPKGLSYVASAIGVPLYMDAITEEGSMIEYAKICVDMDTNKSFPDTIEVVMPNGSFVTINVEYQWKPTICMECKGLRHRKKNCPNIPKEDLRVHNHGKNQWREVKKLHGKEPSSTQVEDNCRIKEAKVTLVDNKVMAKKDATKGPPRKSKVPNQEVTLNLSNKFELLYGTCDDVDDGTSYGESVVVKDTYGEKPCNRDEGHGERCEEEGDLKNEEERPRPKEGIYSSENGTMGSDELAHLMLQGRII